MITRVLPAALAAFLSLSGPELQGQAASSDVLSLSVERSQEEVTARAYLDAIEPGVQGFSFALCHSLRDVVVQSPSPGAAISALAGRSGAEFVALRAGEASGTGIVTMVAVLDFEGRTTFPAGTHELLVVEYSTRPGGTGGSIRLCAAGEADVETLVVRAGSGLVPQTRALSHSDENRTVWEPDRPGSAVT